MNKEPDQVIPKDLRAALIILRVANDRHHDAVREANRRRDQSMEWMRQKPTRTLGDAIAYVGMQAANDERKEAKAALVEAAKAVIRVAVSQGVIPHGGES